ncbi:ECF-type sigma factor [Paenibacillus sp. GCM10027627]|uniref:ECF-type sigma factor n=1 Tax=unclassified Paenibacillus TaxID=185978 RepID=UPI00363C0008
MNEQEAIEQLRGYKQLQARLQVLSTYSVGGGITVSRLNQEDHLQDLHRQLRGMSSHNYLTKHEQRLEQTAHQYLDHYPAGVRSQLKAIPTQGKDAKDNKLLSELRSKVQKVVAARGYDVRSDLDAVLDRLAELQQLQAELQDIDHVLEALEQYKPEFAQLLRFRYLDGDTTELAARKLGVVRQTYHRWARKAISEYVRLAG